MSHVETTLEFPLTGALERLRRDADAASDFARERLSAATRRAGH